MKPMHGRIDRAVRTALRINRFDHLKPDEQECVVRTFQNKGWKLPPDLAVCEPEEELTLEKATKDYLQADEKHRRERNIFAVVRLLEHFGKDCPLAGHQSAADKEIPSITVREGQKCHCEPRNCCSVGYLQSPS